MSLLRKLWENKENSMDVANFDMFKAGAQRLGIQSSPLEYQADYDAMMQGKDRSKAITLEDAMHYYQDKANRTKNVMNRKYSREQ